MFHHRIHDARLDIVPYPVSDYFNFLASQSTTKAGINFHQGILTISPWSCKYSIWSVMVLMSSGLSCPNRLCNTWTAISFLSIFSLSFLSLLLIFCSIIKHIIKINSMLNLSLRIGSGRLVILSNICVWTFAILASFQRPFCGLINANSDIISL